jgi:hypothetical protein
MGGQLNRADNILLSGWDDKNNTEKTAMRGG